MLLVLYAVNVVSELNQNLYCIAISFRDKEKDLNKIPTSLYDELLVHSYVREFGERRL